MRHCAVKTTTPTREVQFIHSFTHSLPLSLHNFILILRNLIIPVLQVRKLSLRDSDSVKVAQLTMADVM